MKQYLISENLEKTLQKKIGHEKKLSKAMAGNCPFLDQCGMEGWMDGQTNPLCDVWTHLKTHL